MEKVYVVTSKMYNSTHIDCAFSSLKKAKEYINFMHDLDFNDMEETIIDPPTNLSDFEQYTEQELRRLGYSFYNVIMEENGNVTRIATSTAINNPYLQCSIFDNALHITLWAKHERHTIKLAHEKRIQIIFNGEWK